MKFMQSGSLGSLLVCCPDYEVELHQEDGRIVFAFKETEIPRVMLEPGAIEMLRSTALLVALTDAEGLERLEQAGFHVDVAERFGSTILAEAGQAS